MLRSATARLIPVSVTLFLAPAVPAPPPGRTGVTRLVRAQQAPQPTQLGVVALPQGGLPAVRGIGIRAVKILADWSQIEARQGETAWDTNLLYDSTGGYRFTPWQWVEARQGWVSPTVYTEGRSQP